MDESQVLDGITIQFTLEYVRKLYLTSVQLLVFTAESANTSKSTFTSAPHLTPQKIWLSTSSNHGGAGHQATMGGGHQSSMGGGHQPTMGGGISQLWGGGHQPSMGGSSTNWGGGPSAKYGGGGHQPTMGGASANYGGGISQVWGGHQPSMGGGSYFPTSMYRKSKSTELL